ncbi:hypothetical protein BDM02DRAFT_3191359 [Thelephora ganbajun]|uniref:Uncharacterized protein n=1 Tax=Thelephora ganbajun TaxID=370292 RepID=A0ACB6Z2Y8_THEGA|nr:hypothetical protein BDM02DRAFT_3191359 [Thelephora ganbajun]
MTLENNRTFISPRNQRITRIDERSHMKHGSPTKDSYGFDYPTMPSLVDAVICQEDSQHPCCQFASGCSFDDIVWQQAIGACMNMDHNRRGRDMGDDESVLFDLVSSGIIDHQSFDEPHKWSSRSIRYSAVVADRLWSLFEAERSRNDRLEWELHELKGTVSLINTRLLAVDRHSFDANKKVNDELAKDSVRLNRHRCCLDTLQEKHNNLVLFSSNLSDSVDLHRRSLIALREGMCTCVRPESSPIDGSGTVPSFSHSPPSSRPRSPPAPSREAMAVVSESPVVAPIENDTPIPVPPPCCAPRRTVMELSTTLQVITEEEEQALEDRIIGARQDQGHPVEVGLNIPVGLESNENSVPRCDVPVVTLSREQMETLSPGARGYWLLSMMRAVMMMPNSTVFARLRSSDNVGGELQLIFPISQEEFDSLLSGEISAEVRAVWETEVVCGGVEDEEELEYSDGLTNWDGANADVDLQVDSMQLAACIGEQLLVCLEFAEAQVQTLENALQLQVLGLDTLLNQHSKDCHYLLGWNAALECKVEELTQGMATLEGEFSVLVVRMEGLEQASSSEYLLIKEMLCLGTGEDVLPLSSDEALSLGICPDYSLLLLHFTLKCQVLGKEESAIFDLRI